MELHTGDIVKVGHGRYTLGNILGQGDHSVVFDALGAEGEQVALKVSPEPSWGNQQDWRAMEQEPSEHLVRVLEADRSPDGFLMVMERVDGVGFRQLCDFLREEQRRVAPHLAVELIYQAARGLEDVFAHTGQAHGDIKPANLMLDRQGVVKLLDYGVGRVRSFGAFGRLPCDVTYLAPEQAELEGECRDDHRSDLFALGAILYELVVGEPLYPFDAQQASYQQLYIVARGDVSGQLERVREEQPALFEVLHLALARDPEERFHNVSELAGMLAGLAIELPRVVPLELFAEALYQTLHTGRWTPSLEVALPDRALDSPTVAGRVRRNPFEVQQRKASSRPSVLPRLLREDEFFLEPRPGMGMLIGMVLLIAAVITVTLMLWRPLGVKETVRLGAEFFSSQPAFVSPDQDSSPNSP